MKKCPYCAEEIQDEAIKCRHCGEAIVGDVWRDFCARYATLGPTQAKREYEKLTDGQKQIFLNAWKALGYDKAVAVARPAPAKQSSAGAVGCLVVIIAIVFFYLLAQISDSGSDGRPSRPASAPPPAAESSKATAPVVKYPGPWRTDFYLDITKALSRRRVTGCGQYKYRPSSQRVGEFLVHCTADGSRWVAYEVRTYSDTVNGPMRVDPELKR